MKVEVRPVNIEGRPLKTAARKEFPAAVGVLKLFEHRFHPFNRNVRMATLTDEKDGTMPSLLPDLLDAEIIWLDDKAMRIRGQELVGGRFLGQTWDVKVL